MILGIGVEAEVFLYAVLTGISVLSVYKALSCFRHILPHSSLAEGVEDLLFWLGASVYIFRQMYETTYGSIRWVFVRGVLFGAGGGIGLLKLAAKVLRLRKRHS